jgi:hypothetical protein
MGHQVVGCDDERRSDDNCKNSPNKITGRRNVVFHISSGMPLKNGYRSLPSAELARYSIVAGFSRWNASPTHYATEPGFKPRGGASFRSRNFQPDQRILNMGR